MAAKKKIDPLERYKGERAAEETKKENKTLLKRLHAAEKRADVAEALRVSAKPPKPVKAKKLVNLHKRLATPVFHCSDWHVEETVLPETVGGHNEYNLEVADRRIERLGDAMCWMIDHNRKSFEIRDAVIWLGGDLISGYIHDELKETNALSPVEALLWLQPRIQKMLSKVLSMPGIESVTVPCNYGNHGRTTHKSQISSGAANSYEWLMYHQLRRSYESNSKVQFHVADGMFLRLKVHGSNLGFHHGDGARYGGGVGGVMIPLQKATAKWNSYGYCDVWNFGHFHQYHDLPRIVVNSSLIGTSAYGMAVGAYEQACQASYLIDSKRGKCMSTALWVEDKK